MPWAGDYIGNMLNARIVAADVPTATANNIAAGGVGSYAFAVNTYAAKVTFGTIYAGSNLKPTSVNASKGSSLSGTWRCMGYNDTTGSGTLYLRVL